MSGAAASTAAGSSTAPDAAGRDDPRGQAAENLLAAFCKLLKASRLYDGANQAVVSSVDGLCAAVAELCQRAGAANAGILFADNTVFINGQSFRMTRETYIAAMQVGALLEKCGISEVALDRSAQAAAVSAFSRALSEQLANPAAAKPVSSLHFDGVRTRRVRGSAGQAESTDGVPPAVRLYATALVIVWSYLGQLRKGPQPLPHAIKRISQRLVAAAEDDPRLLLALTATRVAEREVGLAVNTAVLAVLMARKLTTDRMALSGLVMAALLYDLGRARLLFWTGAGGERLSAVERQLSDGEEARLAASTATAMTALSQIRPGVMPRTVVGYEAIALKAQFVAGPVYGGRRSPSGLGRILAAARTFNELVTPTGSEAMTLDDVVAQMSDEAADDTDRAYLSLLLATLGIFPAGTTVELNTGETALVLTAPAKPVDFARPPVRVLTAPGGGALSQAFDLDLAAPPAGQPARYIRRTIAVDEEQMKAMRAYVATLAGSRRPPRPKRVPPPRPAAPPPPPRPLAVVPPPAGGAAASRAETALPMLSFDLGSDAGGGLDLPPLPSPAAPILDLPGMNASPAAADDVLDLPELPPPSGASALDFAPLPPAGGVPAFELPPLPSTPVARAAPDNRAEPPPEVELPPLDFTPPPQPAPSDPFATPSAPVPAEPVAGAGHSALAELASASGELTEQELEAIARDATRRVNPEDYALLEKERSGAGRAPVVGAPAPPQPPRPAEVNASRRAPEAGAAGPRSSPANPASSPGLADSELAAVADEFEAATVRLRAPSALRPTAPPRTPAPADARPRTPAPSPGLRPPSPAPSPGLRPPSPAPSPGLRPPSPGPSARPTQTPPPTPAPAQTRGPSSSENPALGALAHDELDSGESPGLGAGGGWEQPTKRLRIGRKPKHVDKTDYSRVLRPKESPAIDEVLAEDTPEPSAAAPRTRGGR